MPKTKADAMGDMAGLEKAVAKSDFDAVIAVSPENVRYAGDVHISTQVSIRDRLAFIVWPKGRDPIFLVCLIEAGYVRRESWIGDVRTYQEFVKEPIEALAEILRELKVDGGHVALETEYLGAKYYAHLVKLCPKLKLSPAEPLFARVRMFKTQREKDTIVGAFHGTEKAFLSTYSSVQVGETEKQISIRLADNILLNGAEMVAFNHLNCGLNTGFPHMAPSDYRVQKGDIVKADSGGFFHEYYSNVGRTAKVGQPTQAEKDSWKRLREVHHAIIDMCRPGALGRDLFAKAKAMQEKAGFQFPYSHNGHGIGLNVHERPVINPHEDIPYEAGMITTVETRHRDVGRLGLHMEDIIEITDKGPIWHARFFQNEEIFVI
ncbi:MAG: aminopeptidase P family protein [Alphaproteobacteria bacterium]|nr:aminopeptidase P family protein [Alphaproteobacteria bacterium]